MARIDVTVLKSAIDHVNDRMKRAGSDYSYRYGSRNGFHCVDTYKGEKQLFTAGIGTARECISGLYSDAFDRVADAYSDHLRELRCEPDIHRSPDAELAEVLDSMQNSIERSEAFPLNTDLMKFLTEKVDSIRALTGVEAYKPSDDGECAWCGSTPGHRDLTCPVCTDPDGNDKF